jgi:hypothetical protein
MKMTPQQIERAAHRYILAFYDFCVQHGDQKSASYDAIIPEPDEYATLFKQAGIEDKAMQYRVRDWLQMHGVMDAHSGAALSSDGLALAEALWAESQRSLLSKWWERSGSFVNGIILGAIGQAIIQAACQNQQPWWVWWR